MNTLDIAIVSHTDLDGYYSSFLVNTALKDFIYKDIDISVDEYHVGYSEIYDTLVKVFANVKDNAQIVLYITDLGINEKIAELIVENKNKLEALYVFDHHNNDQNVLDKLETLPGQIVVQKGFSASKLIFDNYVNINSPNIKKMVRYVNAWDIHDFNNYEDFEIGQMLNDLFYDLIEHYYGWCPREIQAQVMNCFMDVLTDTIDATTFESVKEQDLAIRRFIHKTFLEYTFYNSLRDRIVKTEFNDKHLENVQQAIYTLGFKQSNAAMAAYIATVTSTMSGIKTIQTPFGDYRYIVDENRMGMELVHHLIYTFGVIDAIFLIRNGEVNKRVEIRQNSLKSGLDMSALAKTFGGGGHYNASGFPLAKDFDKVNLIKRIDDTVALWWSNN